MDQLFHCNYLTSKDFASLNYLFNPQACVDAPSLGCLMEVLDRNASNNKGCFRIMLDMSIKEDETTCLSS